MRRIRCFLLDPTDRVSQSLRRYSNGHWDAATNAYVYDRPCPQNDGRYHEAMVRIEDAPVIPSEHGPGVIANGTCGEVARYRANGADAGPDPRWPTHCATCGYAFVEDDEWQVFCDRLYLRTDDPAQETTLRDAPAGAMWRSPWEARFWHSQDAGDPICVKLPDGTDWCVDSQATNCNWPGGDRKQDQHHCWPRQGEPPDVSVNKDFSPTCTAGAGSIASPGYHGFLRNGFLED